MNCSEQLRRSSWGGVKLTPRRSVLATRHGAIVFSRELEKKFEELLRALEHCDLCSFEAEELDDIDDPAISCLSRNRIARVEPAAELRTCP